MAVRFLQVVSTIPLYTFIISRGEKSESKASCLANSLSQRFKAVEATEDVKF